MSPTEGTPVSRLSRRSLLTGAAATAALSLGGGLGTGSAHAAAAFVKGADISWASQMEANGYIWRNRDGVQQDLLTILKSYGITAIRLRTFVNPSDDPHDGHCSIEETAAMALRVKNAGMQVMISYIFGDTWNSVGRQVPPAAWASMTYSQLREEMAQYVYHSMNVLKYHRVSPTWVAIGNETNSGVCKPVGSVSSPAQMAGLLMAAHAQVKYVFPSALTLVHLGQPQNLASVRNFLDAYRNNGGQWDITGLSSYAQGGNVASVLGNMETLQSTYGKPVMQVEYGGPVGKPAQVRSSLSAFITGLKGFGGLGTFFWEPQGYTPFIGGYGSCAWDPTTLRPTAALDGFLDA
ncbi:glycosyl hydrolase 53 family protein [Streptomyces tauricus]|uniref:glycosyl hydrolase 53 family protein n=1 Tax=Streptomyces tauricus TaxID=68274 RepID=UPI00341EA552